jgi:hypothetical protein
MLSLRFTEVELVNGHQEFRNRGHETSGRTATRIPGTRPADLLIGSSQRHHPFPAEGLGESLGLALGDDDVGVG